MNEDWLAEPVCWGFGSVYRVALMSGGSRRLWNQLLRSAPSFVLSSLFNPLAHSRLRAFARFLLSLSSLYIPFSLSLFLSLALALSISISLREGCEGKDLFHIGRNYTDTESRRTDFAEGQQSPWSGPPVYIRIPLLPSHNLRQLPSPMSSIAEIEP